MALIAIDNRQEKQGETGAARAWRRLAWITLILLAAAAFRLAALSGAPPGMTHDEADHGLTAWSIVNGARDLYFTIGYGREPLYDYATALVMAGAGPTIFAARLTAAYFSLITVAAAYAWARRAFGRPAALLVAAGLATGFWPVMAGRQALRSAALPALFTLAALFFWQGMRAAGEGRAGRRSWLVACLVAGLCLGLTAYTYIPARVLWLALPATTACLILAAPRGERHAGRRMAGTGLALAAAAGVAAPLFLYLAGHPGLEVRIDELSAPLRAAGGGDFAPLWANARGALRLFTVEGDHAWRYNIPGKPFLGPVMGALFYAGALLAGWSVARGVWKGRHKDGKGMPDIRSSSVLPDPAAAFLALAWLLLGFSPVLVTGPDLSTTQAIGLLPVLYLFPALALVAGYGALRRRAAAGTARTAVAARPAVLVALVLFAGLGGLTARDYFGRWANAPEVRVQYETTMVTALRYLDEHGTGAAAVSTITPGRFHTPAVALLTLHNPAVTPRWFDGRQSVLLPGEAGGLLIVPGFTPIPAELQRYLADATLIDELPMRPDDLDRPVRVYRLNAAGLGAARMTPPLTDEGHAKPVDFRNAVLLGYDLPATTARPGETLTLVTAWRLEQPLPEASIFAQLLGPDGAIAAADGLGAPGDGWLLGDTLLQSHTLAIPAGAPAGTWPLVTGLYSQADGRRLLTGDGDDRATLTMVTVLDE